ncbi:MAG: NADPH-dependent glutamate synthase [Candidatus Omnitrophota bacterium]|jgi:glutamate synthase (NADPH/NADH) small chain|nr:MAG: NADPH-dependent glutamate synthase [Candidatus Omnitrophota bacterium]
MRNKVPQQPPKKRISNFFEVALGYSKEQAEAEAKRCLQCKQPACVKGCPVQINIPAFIKLIKEGKRKEALSKIKERNNLPAVCGRVCPQEDQCEAACILNKKKIPINIGALERYASDYELENKQHLEGSATGAGTKVAVVGSGPAGLTCAADLAKLGFKVTVFESLHFAGGVLTYGIPEFRLPKQIVANELDYIRSLGVEIKPGILIGNTFSIKDLFQEGYKAVFIATGAGLPQFLDIPGESAKRVYSANEFLTRVNLMKAYKFPEYATPIAIGKKVAVIGAGNVAMDSARVALRLGASVSLVYRRTEVEMPARVEEVQNAKEEGVKFFLLSQPKEILMDKNGFAIGLKCIKMKLGEPDASGRKRPLPVEDSDFIIEADTVIVAIGQSPNPLLPKTVPGIKMNADGTIQVNDNMMTSIPGVFAGGDIVTGADTVISAMGAGKKAAVEIEKYINKI